MVAAGGFALALAARLGLGALGLALGLGLGLGLALGLGFGATAGLAGFVAGAAALGFGDGDGVLGLPASLPGAPRSRASGCGALTPRGNSAASCSGAASTSGSFFGLGAAAGFTWLASAETAAPTSWARSGLWQAAVAKAASCVSAVTPNASFTRSLSVYTPVTIGALSIPKTGAYSLVRAWPTLGPPPSQHASSLPRFSAVPASAPKTYAALGNSRRACSSERQ